MFYSGLDFVLFRNGKLSDKDTTVEMNPVWTTLLECEASDAVCALRTLFYHQLGAWIRCKSASQGRVCSESLS